MPHLHIPGSNMFSSCTTLIYDFLQPGVTLLLFITLSLITFIATKPKMILSNSKQPKWSCSWTLGRCMSSRSSHSRLCQEPHDFLISFIPASILVHFNHPPPHVTHAHTRNIMPSSPMAHDSSHVKHMHHLHPTYRPLRLQLS